MLLKGLEVSTEHREQRDLKGVIEEHLYGLYEY
jgi:hypothetical protein